VECEVCKVYSKLQTYGIAAALKILFSEKLGGEKEIILKRNELIVKYFPSKIIMKGLDQHIQ
jgi:hypothetical protein